VPRKGLRVRVPCPPLSGNLDAAKCCGVYLVAPTVATTRNRQAAIGTAYEHSVDGRLATSREALRARARNAKGEALADAAEESADEIYESINEIGANLS